MDLASISTFQFHTCFVTLKYSILIQTNLILLKTCFPNGAWLLATSNRNELQISVSFNLDHRGLNDLDIKIGLSKNAKKTFPKMTATSYSGQGGVFFGKHKMLKKILSLSSPWSRQSTSEKADKWLKREERRDIGPLPFLGGSNIASQNITNNKQRTWRDYNNHSSIRIGAHMWFSGFSQGDTGDPGWPRVTQGAG